MKHHAVEVCLTIPGGIQAAAAVLLCAMLVGCVGATPLPKRTLTPSGTEVKTIDVTFIHPGQTTRDEVREKLKIIDTGYQGDRFFLGHWSQSTWGGWIVLAGTCCSAVGGGGRVWHSGNLLVEFDDAGVVKRSEPFKDREATSKLTTVAENTPLALNDPVELNVKYWKGAAVPVPAKIVLTARSLDFEELGDQKKKDKFSLPANEVRGVGSWLAMTAADANYTGQRIRCAHDLRTWGGPRGKHIFLQLTLPQVVTLMSYADQAGKSAPKIGH